MTGPFTDRASRARVPARAAAADESGFDALMSEAHRSVRWLAGAMVAFLICLLMARIRTPLLWLAAAPLAFAALELFTLWGTLRRLAHARPIASSAALDAALAESRAKSKFLAEMSHELRTPLNAVIGFSEMMAQEVLGPHAVPTYRDYAQDIHASGRHLLSLADDVLDLARIETGHRELFETAVSLETLAQDCSHMMRLAASQRSVSLTIHLAPVPRLWADERAVRQMTLNLLTNAVKFTPQGGAVRLRVALDASGRPYLAVEDTGPGMGDAELPLALSPRHRESALDRASGRGAGLGLAIVHGLADLHGAELTLADRASGGTRATLTFPVARCLPEAAEAPAVPTAMKLAAAE